MSGLSIAERIVVSHTRGKVIEEWVIPQEKVTTVTIDDRERRFVTLGYAGDRGFAKFCDGDCNKSNPLATYTFLDTLVRLRSEASLKAMDAVACEKLLTHRSGQPVKNASQLLEFLPKMVTVSCPAVGDIGPTDINVIPECIQTHKSISVECTLEVFNYVQRAMIASRAETSARARPPHQQRLSARTGVKGVHRMTGNRVRMQVTDSDGKVSTKTRKLAAGSSDPAVAMEFCQSFANSARDADTGEDGVDAEVVNGDDTPEMPPADATDELDEVVPQVGEHALAAPPADAAEEPPPRMGSDSSAPKSSTLTNEWSKIFRKANV